MNSTLLAYTLANSSSFVWAVVPDIHSAEQLRREILFFAPSRDSSVWILPDWETLPYDTFSPHPDLTSDRLRLLTWLPTTQDGILIVTVPALFQPLPSLEYLQLHSLQLTVGQTIDLSAKRLQLEQAGYHCVREVISPGEFAVRGSIIDIFPMGTKLPYRIDLLGLQIDSIRTFDLETQRSLKTVERVELLPAREYPLDELGVRQFVSQWLLHWPEKLDAPVLEAVEAYQAYAGLEYYLPLFFGRVITVFDYLPKGAPAYLPQDCDAQLDAVMQTIEHRYQQHRYNPDRPLLPPSELFMTLEALKHHLKQFPSLAMSGFDPLPDISIDTRSKFPLERLHQWLIQQRSRIFFSCESAGRLEVVQEHLIRLGIRAKVCETFEVFQSLEETPGIGVSPLIHGGCFGSLIVVTEYDLFKERVFQVRRRRTSAPQGILLKNLSDLRTGDAVVHAQHGVGRYQGLAKLEIRGYWQEFLKLTYANEDILYVPTTALGLLTRYGSQEGVEAPLHRLGTDRWQKEKQKAAEAVRDVAAELLQVYAKRESEEGFAYPPPDEDYVRFVDQFPFEETPDQLAAIEAIFADMQSTRPMDRLLCGDVGFGKTEVALRASYLAVSAQRQVAVLVPTTLLAEQHFNTFRDRFAQWPVRIEVLSRFHNKKNQQNVLKSLAEGKVDIIIGTHALLNPAIEFKCLGLLVVDEEHRFGVTHKEQIKALRSQVDILTMTATPIPRTLNLALSHLRDLSIIATPPQKRLSVKTFVQEFQNAQVQEAVSRELNRGGQVFFVHNAVETIEAIAEDLRKLLPNVRIGVAHGQLREKQLEQVMSDFYHNRYQVLLCTTIIETGIDIPNANTIIIHKADRFGLAQLHQLRGRVGRSHHQAYAYLFVEELAHLTAEAQKRLQAIVAADALGSGFSIASSDLEIRGGGELLGDRQSGHIQAIGFELYRELLDRTVAALKSGQMPDKWFESAASCEVEVQASVLIPEDYLADVSLRLYCYQRISAADTDEALQSVRLEMIDRFGLFPSSVKHLFQVAELKLVAKKLGISRLEASSSSLQIEFLPQNQVNGHTVLALVKQNPQRYAFKGPLKLTCQGQYETPERRIEALFEWLQQLQK